MCGIFESVRFAEFIKPEIPLFAEAEPIFHKSGAGAFGVAKSTAAIGDCAVSIRAAGMGVQRNFLHFGMVLFFEPCIKGVIEIM